MDGFDPVDAAALDLALAQARAHGMLAFLVGGAVRNARLGVPVKDLDLVVDADNPQAVLDLTRDLARRLRGSYVPLDPGRGIARIVLEGGRDLDLATRCGPTLEEDLRRRDFTVNAIAWNPRSGEVRDPTGGCADLERKVLRPCTRTSLVEDPLRLLRAIRMLCSFPLQPAPGLLDQLRAHARLLARVSAERIRDEFFACLGAGLPPWWEVMVESELLFQVLPEMRPAAGIRQDHFHHLDVLSHSAEALRRVEAHAAVGFVDLTDHGPRLERHLARPMVVRRSASDLLKLAVLLHDVGKPGTQRLEPSGKIRFPGHALRGAALAEGIGARLVLSRREVWRLARLVALHLRPQALAMVAPTATGRHRLFRVAGDVAPELLVLSAADVEASRGPGQTAGRLARHRELVRQMLDEFFQEGRVARPKIPVTGRDLARILGVPPGPLMGRLLERLAEAVAEGSVGSREEATALVAEWLSKESRTAPG